MKAQTNELFYLFLELKTCNCDYFVGSRKQKSRPHFNDNVDNLRNIYLRGAKIT